MKRGERPYPLFRGWCGVSYTCYQYMAELGLELAILGSAVRLTVDCARESGLQNCGLFLRPLAKMRMHFLNVSHLMTNPTKCPLRPAKTQISLGIRPVWMPRLICVFTDRNGQFVGFVMRPLMHTLQLSRLASRASLTADPGVAGSTLVRPHIVHWNWSCASFPFFHW